MSYSDLVTISDTAATNTPSVTTPAGAAASTGKTFKYGTPSSQQTGRLSGSGLDIISSTPIPAASNTIDPAAANLPISPLFPYNGIDTFTNLANDSGVITQAQDFNALVSAVRTVEAYTGHILRYAPGDLVDRLSSSDRFLNGVDNTNGVTSSGIRRPLTCTLGTYVSFSGTTTQSVAATPLALSTAQKSALGMTSTVEALGGLTWRAGAKLQKPSVDPGTLDPEACVGRVEVRLDSNGTIQLYLCPGPYIIVGVDNNLFPINGGTPYLAPGTWYLWITLYLSPYVWP